MDKAANVNGTGPASGLGKLLVARGKLAEPDLQRAERVLAISGGTLGQALVRLGLVAEKEVADAVSELTGCALIGPDDFPEAPVAEERISGEFLQQFNVLPLADDGECLRVAMADPSDDYVLRALEIATERRIEPLLALASDLEQAHERLYGGGRSAMDQIVDGVQSDAVLQEDVEDVERLKDMASDAPVIRVVNLVFSRALEARASDIHIEPYEHELKISGKEVDLRVSTVPTLHGESVVMRILDKQTLNLNLEDIGLSDKVLSDLKSVLERPNGIFLVTGPTGSGKTTTLYAVLSRMNTPERKIMTVEDPVEYQIAGVNQIQAAPRIGLDFAHALRSIVRQDPDVIMIGEMRDRETAGIAIQSALTGHIVFSTLHTNDSASGVTRLLDMGLEDYLLTSTVNAIMAQRLVRVLCPACRRESALTDEEVQHMGISRLVERAGSRRVWRATGCEACARTGYRGRMGVHELLLVDDSIRHLILEHASAEVIMKAARANGMVTMYEDGVLKAFAGHTSIDEVLRVTHQ